MYAENKNKAKGNVDKPTDRQIDKLMHNAKICIHFELNHSGNNLIKIAYFTYLFSSSALKTFCIAD